jgi:hypothetical protein
MFAAGALLIALCLWFCAMAGIIWSWNRHVPIVVAAGVDVEKDQQHINFGRIVRAHTLGWTAFFFGLFLVMALSEFPVWQRVGIAVMLSVIYGLSRIKRGETSRLGKGEPSRVAMFGELRDKLWYRILAITEWVGYFGVIIFATELVARPFSS